MTPVALNPTTVTSAGDREALTKAAQGFEAILLRQFLAAARKTDFGGDDLFGSQAMGTFRQMQDDHFAAIAAQTGAFGLARMIEAQVAGQTRAKE